MVAIFDNAEQNSNQETETPHNFIPAKLEINRKFHSYFSLALICCEIKNAKTSVGLIDRIISNIERVFFFSIWFSR